MSLLSPCLILNGIKGKNGTRKYKSPDKKSNMIFAEDLIQIHEVQGFSKIKNDDDNRLIKYTYYSKGYALRNIYKILVKTALALLPEDKFSHFIYSAKNLIKNIPATGLEKIVFTTYPGLGVFELIVRGYFRKKKDLSKPTYIFYLCCGNFSFQVPIFSDSDIITFKKGEKIILDIFPLDDYDLKINGEKPIVQLLDCTSDKLVERGYKTFTLRYDKKIELI